MFLTHIFTNFISFFKKNNSHITYVLTILFYIFTYYLLLTILFIFFHLILLILFFAYIYLSILIKKKVIYYNHICILFIFYFNK